MAVGPVVPSVHSWTSARHTDAVVLVGARRSTCTLLRLLRATDTDDLAARLRSLLGHDLAASVTTEAIGLVPHLFGTEQGEGVSMAMRAAGAGEDPATIAGSLVTLASDLRSSLS